MLLLAMMLVPLVFAALIVVAPAERAQRLALVGTLVPLALGVQLLTAFDWSRDALLQFTWSLNADSAASGASDHAWLSDLGINLSVGVDGVAAMLVLLTLLLGPICVLASTTAITERLKTYYGWLLVLQAAMVGVFIARDLILFYICFEFTLVPMYILISLYGSTNRKKAATKFFLYTFTGSLIALAGLVYIAWHHAATRGFWTFDIALLELSARNLSSTEQAWVLAAMLLGFAVKVPLFPFHTWLPLAHTEAPTAGSVILAGVLLKLGTYGLFRFAWPMAPAAVVEYAPWIAGICIVGILYGGLICWVQRDVKKLVAYSSVAHLGFCVLGLAALNNTGVTGSVLYMINHGLSTGALFLLIGMMYERYHTRSMDEVGGLASKMPVWATFMVFFTMASVGLPGLNGFVSEFLCLFGAFQADSAWGSATVGGTMGRLGFWYAAIAGVGMIIAAIYLLYMLRKVCFGELREPAGHHDHHEGHSVLPADLTRREVGILLPLAVLCVVLGVYPKPAIEGMDESVSRLVDHVRSAAEQRPAAPPAPPAAPAEAAPDAQPQEVQG